MHLTSGDGRPGSLLFVPKPGPSRAQSDEALKRLDVEREPVMFGKRLQRGSLSDDMHRVGGVGPLRRCTEAGGEKMRPGGKERTVKARSR